MSYKFINVCPACCNGGVSEWYIEGCGHQAYIWTDLDVGCQCCCKYHNILDWYFDCGNRICKYNNISDRNFECKNKGRITNVFRFLDAINCLAEANNIPDDIWREMRKKLTILAKEKLK